MMWVLKPGPFGWQYEKRKREVEVNRDEMLEKIRGNAADELWRLFHEYHEEVPGDPPGSEPTYPLRG